MEIPDTPLSMPDHYGNCGAQYEAAVGDGGMVPIADLMDRGIGNGTAGFSDITEEMRQPTNATATQGAGDPTGGGEPGKGRLPGVRSRIASACDRPPVVSYFR